MISTFSGVPPNYALTALEPCVMLSTFLPAALSHSSMSKVNSACIWWRYLHLLSSTCSGCKAFWSRTITCHSKCTAPRAAGWQPLNTLLKSDFHPIFYSKSLCTETWVEKNTELKICTSPLFPSHHLHVLKNESQSTQPLSHCCHSPTCSSLDKIKASRKKMLFFTSIPTGLMQEK